MLRQRSNRIFSSTNISEEKKGLFEKYKNLLQYKKAVGLAICCLCKKIDSQTYKFIMS
jgi:hypothetical protein